MILLHDLVVQEVIFFHWVLLVTRGLPGTSLWIDPFTETFVVLFTSRLHPNGKGGVVSLRKKVANVVAAAILELPPLRDRLLRRF